MAKKRRNSNGFFDSFNVVNVDFSVEDRKIISAWLEKSVFKISDSLLAIVDAGWKVSISYDAYNRTYIITLTDKTQKNDGEKALVLMFRHNDLERLFGIVSWVWGEVLSEDGVSRLLEDADLDW